MAPNRRLLFVLALSILPLAALAGPAERALVDPFPLRFPLVEAGQLEVGGHIVGQPWARDGVLYYATSEGHLTAVVVPSRGVLWRRPVEGAGPRSSGPPSPSDTAGSMSFETMDSKLAATDTAGQVRWEFSPGAALSAGLAVRDGGVFVGTADRMFYCLATTTGKIKWKRRLQGAPVHPAVVAGGVLAVAASNSVVYRLSARGGSILSWEAVPSRIVYEPAAAGPLVLISSAAPTVTAIDLRTGKRAGQHEAPGVLVAGAVWSSPYVVLFVESPDTGRQRIIFLRSR